MAARADSVPEGIKELLRRAVEELDHETGLEFADELGRSHALFDHFMTSMEDLNLPTRDGIELVNDLEVTSEMRKAPGWLDEWNYWKGAALACAALNYKEGESGRPQNTEEHVGDVFAEYFMTVNPLAKPRYNVAIAAMKFATHQVRHAFGRVHGLPYPDPDGTRSYTTLDLDIKTAVSAAVETAATGSSKLEREAEERWPKFLEATAERVGFDMKNIT
jgi:hypothetical protein